MVGKFIISTAFSIVFACNAKYINHFGVRWRRRRKRNETEWAINKLSLCMWPDWLTFKQQNLKVQKTLFQNKKHENAFLINSQTISQCKRSFSSYFTVEWIMRIFLTIAHRQMIFNLNLMSVFLLLLRRCCCCKLQLHVKEKSNKWADGSNFVVILLWFFFCCQSAQQQ